MDEAEVVKAFCKGLLAVAREASKSVAPSRQAESEARLENLEAALKVATADDEMIAAFLHKGRN